MDLLLSHHNIQYPREEDDQYDIQNIQDIQDQDPLTLDLDHEIIMSDDDELDSEKEIKIINEYVKLVK
jgi:hypothetical protein